MRPFTTTDWANKAESLGFIAITERRWRYGDKSQYCSQLIDVVADLNTNREFGDVPNTVHFLVVNTRIETIVSKIPPSLLTDESGSPLRGITIEESTRQFEDVSLNTTDLDVALNYARTGTT